MMASFVLVLLVAMAANGDAAQQGVGSIITQSVFNSMLPNRNSSLCPAKGFYTYDAFIEAARAFPEFGTSGSAELMKREIAAFFGQTSHDTTGGTRGAADQFEWGYCFKEEINKATSRPYYGRGPIQLTGLSNYQLAGNALGVDLVSNPDLVSTDPVISFKTAIWFWMTAQSPKPSCHDVILGNWKPTVADTKPGYGVIIQIVDGDFLCGSGPNSAIFDSIGFYKRYCDMLDIGNGDTLDCKDTQQRFPDQIVGSASKLNKTIILSSALGSVAAVAITAVSAYFYFNSKYRRWKNEQDKLAKIMHGLPGVPTKVEFTEIKKATKNFHDTMKLGKGGFGAVYRCTLPASASMTGQPMEVAVKKFMQEVENRRFSIINRLRHKNIVPLIGWSYNKGVPLLVYEYMTNGSLDQHLFGGGGNKHHHVGDVICQWETRYSIVRDIATGLHYVHHEHEPMVLHRDKKASNIMLDSTFRARLGDFGIACTVATNKSYVTGFAGTFGYIAPDYAMSYKATRQTDVYAFGVLILEVVTGKKNGDVRPDDDHITEWVWRLHREGVLLQAVDNKLIITRDRNIQEDAIFIDEAKRLLLLGLTCTNPNPSNRPSMAEVVQVISKLAPMPEVPLERPTFVWPPEDWRMRNSMYSTAMSTWEGGSGSTSTITLSHVNQDKPTSNSVKEKDSGHCRAASECCSVTAAHSSPLEIESSGF